MISIRIIPVLLLKDNKLVKTVKFKGPAYVGDIINAAKILNEKEVDELMVLDISASEYEQPNFSMIAEVAGECFMPLGYGGGISSIEHIKRLFAIGIEKVIINSAAVQNKALISEAASKFGSQSIVVSIDVKKNLFGKRKVYTQSGKFNTGLDPLAFALEMQERGAGEIFLNSIDKDGTMSGYDMELIKSFSDKLNIPLIVCGGAKELNDFKKVKEMGVSACAAGSMFVFKGPHKAVLINYPSQLELQSVQ